jgi:hypothetical protein
MALTNVELYEALKDRVGEEAARLIADVVPAADELATKHDLLATKHDLDREISGVRLEVTELRGEMREGFAAVRGEIQKSSKETMRWILTFMIPMWAGTWGTLLAVLLKH